MGRHRRVLGTAAVVAVAMLAGALVLVYGPWAARTASWGDALSTVSSLLAAGCCLYAARRTAGPTRRSWVLFGSTMAMWSTGDILWSLSALSDRLGPVVPVANVLYLLGLVPVVAGLLLFPVGEWERGAGPRLVVDALVLGCALLLVSYLLVLREVVDRAGPNWDALVYGIYPVTDVLMAGLAALLLLRTAGRPRLDLMLIGLAFAVWTAADNGYALLSVRDGDYTRTMVEVAYVVAPLLLGLAAVAGLTSGAGVNTVRRHVTGTFAALLPDLAAIGAVALCVVVGLQDWPDWVVASLAVALTGMRQLLVTADNHLLRHTLESRVVQRTEELHDLSHRHQRILESVGEGIFGVDGRGRISFANPAAERMLGWGPGELLGRDACSTLCGPDHDHDRAQHQDPARCPLTTVRILGGVVALSDTGYTRRDGSLLPVDITAAPMLAPRSQGAVVTFRDVTERQVVDLMKQEFVSSVSHELRTPLTAIRGSLEMLADGEAGVLPGSARSIVTLAQRGSERLTRLVNDIIDVERLQTGSFSVSPTPHEVGPLVEIAVSSMRPLAEQAAVHLVVEETRGCALADPDRVVQALVNLIGNALKFTPAGKQVSVSAKPDLGWVRFTVRDEGRGIAEAELETIFERFYQVEKADAKERGGTGLGLTITKSIVERHGGQIEVSSTLGVGSTFWFTLPAAPDGVPRPVTASDEQPLLVPVATGDQPF